MDSKKTHEKLFKYTCDICDYNSCNKNDYNRHLLTLKHKRMTIDDNKNSEKLQTYLCVCGKEYKYRQGLFKHKKKCNINNNEDNDDINTENIKHTDNNVSENIDFKEMFFEMISQNKELQKTIIQQNEQNKVLQNTIQELIPKIGNGNVTNSNNTINNNNVILLLNEKCKDALSINEFLKSIEVNVNDLMYTSKKGVIEGLSKLFLQHYNNIPIVKRPLWCSDKKRKKLFIKEDEWQEDKDQKKTKEAIKILGSIQAKNSNKYKIENPNWFSHDKQKDIYMTIINQTTKSIDEEKQENVLNKLIENIHLSTECKDVLQKNSDT